MKKYSGLFVFLPLFCVVLLPWKQAQAAQSGEKTYQESCASCHDSGMFGAPRVGYRQDWADRLPKGLKGLSNNAIYGYRGEVGFMPPKGGDDRLSDSEVEKAVKYMVDQAW
ncbi:MAG: c-type cytochrome [Hydrogenovibrio sp.]|uniref:c-type cytochrome n=1 Tax=Hydrogenovibrio sp. TaxID=2065821 RepID=UPI0028707E56|nr:c-type cytochrome [Hydrogenovibrio sp.]MDR9499906.1 c-type cytochrome [Hydrogenovibrio sp.]